MIRATVIRAVVVDDQALVRGGFRVLLDSAPDLEVVGEAADGTEAVSVVGVTLPDVVLMDIRMPVLDGLAATREILARHPTVRVLVLTTFDLDAYVYDALRAGASGFLLKDARPSCSTRSASSRRERRCSRRARRACWSRSSPPGPVPGRCRRSRSPR